MQGPDNSKRRDWARCVHQLAHRGNYFTDEPSTSWLGTRQQQVLVSELIWTDQSGVSSKWRIHALTYFMEKKLGFMVELEHVSDPGLLLLRVSVPSSCRQINEIIARNLVK
eukprot:GEMP01055094.1.p1 GENE.GEMP01055094.1~~GEMP01055094.1.p1  ORF type:complete len:111 (+),score=18.43 GEMP01055094.1:291-623(+)